MTKDYVVLGIVLLLVVISGAQAYQLQTISNSIAENPVMMDEAPTQDNRVTAGQNLRDLPQMVGGC